MTGIFGWVGLRSEHPPTLLAAMAGPAREREDLSFSSHCGSGFGVAAIGLPGTAGVFERNGLVAALYGHPMWRDRDVRRPTMAEVAARLIDAFRRQGASAFDSLGGDYACALVDPAADRVLLAVDRMGVRNVTYSEERGGIVFGPSCDAVARHPEVRREIDPQALYDYAYFHMVPGPTTVFRGLHRIPPGHFVEATGGRCAVRPHWRPRFIENAPASAASLKSELRAVLESAVRDFAGDSTCGAFLSGGTDSSTLSGLLGGVTGEAARTFSIGFAAEGYDEMRYARIAAGHFATDQHEYYVTPDDVVASVPGIAAAYDQPFGNASAVPTYYCARLARSHGVTRLLGGDGGDELFGGNARYARQQQLAYYERIPRVIRRGLLEPIAARTGFGDALTPWRKARSYVSQASLPMPERYESYNLLERLGPQNVFDRSFLAQVDADAPLRRMRDVYRDVDAESLINRMLGLDFRFTLADNDLPKVTRMCELAGVDVAFPMLHEDVIDFSLRLPPDLKLRGTRLRHFFKEALSDFLPAEIIDKQKHGFGLPVGAWLQSDPQLRALASDSLVTLRGRGFVRAEFVDRLLDDHLASHAGYYGTMVWVLMMLELWFQRHAPEGP
jgi:asparagine synthase (glutamine-hydrolysing)